MSRVSIGTSSTTKQGVGGINGDGQVVGSYNNSTDCLTSCSFILDVTMGAFTKIVYPGGSYTTALGTNNNGQLVVSAPGTKKSSCIPMSIVSFPLGFGETLLEQVLELVKAKAGWVRL